MRHALFAFVLGTIAGCSEVPGEPESRAPQGATASSLSEYRHLFARSRFAIGPTTTEKAELGIAKVVGEWGVFGTNQQTGMVLASPNADAPPVGREPLGGGPAAHNAAVKDYFVKAGLPEAEVSGVAIHTKASAGGTGLDPASSWKLDAYSSVLSREYDGVPVVDSYAWAQMNDLGEVVTESVYWPAIPQSVLVAASAFKKQLADPPASAAYFAKVPSNGRLVIHHTPGVWEGTFEATVSYDVSSFGKTTHYTAEGSVIALPQELP